MNLNPDDPRLTAYALGELPEAERAQFEAELKASPECQKLVEEIRAAAALLENEFAEQKSLELNRAQRRAIEDRLRPVKSRTEKILSRLFLYGATAAAACVLAAMLLPALSKSKSKARRVAFVATPEIKRSDDRSQAKARVLASVEPATPAAVPLSGSSDQVVVGAPVPEAASGQKELAGKSEVVVNGNLANRSESLNAPAPVLTPPPQSLRRYSAIGLSPATPAPSTREFSVQGGRGPETDEFHANRRPEFSGAPRVDRYFESHDTASYPHLVENSFHSARNQPLSTFSIDVDTASYANVRRFLNEGRMPPRDAVRLEELINYFSYDYPQPRGDDPFSANIEVAGCPWNPEHRLVRIGLHGREIARDKRPPSNFVFLIDVSGSMSPRERLPLLKQALRQLVKKMNAEDRVAIVVYASEAGLKLESTSCEKKEKILRAIDELGAGGSTNGGDGIRQAYRVAEENFIKDGVNRVLLCTDGDFNVGTTDQSELIRLIQREARSGVFLTTLGVGTDNYKDALMQNLADKGNGNYHYLDSLEEAQKVLIDQMNGTLVTIAKDVKIQVEFNPAQVGAYRLIGYEKRLLRKEDFNNDAKDAGEIGAGHTVTALYEIVPPGRAISGAVDDLKYQQPMEEKPERYVTTGSRELLTLKLRYKQPDGERSRLLEFAVTDTGKSFRGASKDFRFAASVASFGMLLRDSEFKGDASYREVQNWAESAKGNDTEGYRAEFINLVRKARSLDGRN